MKNILLFILATTLIFGCTKDLQKKKLRKEKCVILTTMAIYGIGMKVIADKQKVIK